MKVHRLTAEDDLTAAIDLLQRFFSEEGFDTKSDVIAANVHKLAEIDTCGLFVAEVDGIQVGVATVSMEFGIEYGWSAEMGDLYVLPQWGGRGVSRSLIEGVEDFLRLRGAAGYQVTVTPHAEEHHGLGTFYRALGFVDEGRKILFRQF